MVSTSLAAIFGTIVVTLGSFGAGFWIAKWLPASFSAWERVAFQWIAGFGSLSLALFLIGQVIYTKAVIWTAVAVSIILAIRSFEALRREKRKDWKISIPAIAAFVIAVVLGITALAGLAEIIGDWEHDAIAYHLLGPKVWLRGRVVRPLPDTSTTAFPATGEVIFGALFSIGGNRAPGLFAVSILAAFLFVIYSVARGTGLGDRKCWWAVAFTAAMPAVYVGAHSGFIDVLYAAFLLAAARIGLAAESRGDFLIFGAFCGFAIATKYTGLSAVPSLALCAALALVLRSGHAWRAFRDSALALMFALVIASPYFLRNWIVLGFPIYPPPPGVSNLVAVRYFSPAALQGFHSFLYAHGAGFGKSLLAFLSLPYNLTYHTSLFGGAGGIGLVGLAFGPFGLLAARKRVFAQGLALLGFLLVVVWFLSLQESRYLIPAYPIAGVFGVLGWEYVEILRPPFGRLLCGGIIACSLLYGLATIGSGRRDDLHRVISPAYAEKQRKERVPYHEGFAYLNNEQGVKRVLVLDRSVPVYFLNKDYLKPFGQWGEQVLPDASDGQHVLARIHTLGVDHVFDVNSKVSGFQVPDTDADLQLVFEATNLRVYRVK